MIAKNEAPCIANAIASVAPFVDEVLVVDTGSTDATIELARAAGARVEQSAWPDSFADARNTAADLATYNMVLMLDASDVVSGTPVQFKKAIDRVSDGAVVAAWVSLQSATALQQGLASVSLRVYDRRAWRYQGRVHEHLVQTATMAHAAGTLPEQTLAYLHTGYMDPERFREKGLRNATLAQKSLRDDDLSVERRAKLLWDFGRAARQLGRPQAAIAPLREAYGSAEGELRAAIAGELVLALGSAGRPAEAAEYLFDLQSASTASPEWVAWVSSKVMRSFGQLRDARTLLQAATSGPVIAPDGVRYPPAMVWSDLADVLDELGDLDGARAARASAGLLD